MADNYPILVNWIAAVAPILGLILYHWRSEMPVIGLAIGACATGMVIEASWSVPWFLVVAHGINLLEFIARAYQNGNWDWDSAKEDAGLLLGINGCCIMA